MSILFYPLNMQIQPKSPFPKAWLPGVWTVQGKGVMWESLIYPDEKRLTALQLTTFPTLCVSGVAGRVSPGATIPLRFRSTGQRSEHTGAGLSSKLLFSDLSLLKNQTKMLLPCWAHRLRVLHHQ